MDKRTNQKIWGVMAVLLLWLVCATAVGDVIYVDDDAPLGGDGNSWPTAYKYLQDALYRPPAGGDQIWVAAGTYKPDHDEGGNVTPRQRSETFQLINGVALYGGFAGNEDPCSFDLAERDYEANETVLSGDLLGNDTPGLDPCDLPNDPTRAENSYHVVTGSATDATAVLDGSTITAGNASGWGICPESCIGHGGGMFNWSGSPTVTNCTFSGNSSRVGGGGMFNGKSSNAMVTSCTFSGNASKSGGGGMANDDSSSPTLTDCTFEDNWAGHHGGGLANWKSCAPSLVNCTFSRNEAVTWGGGMNNGESSPILTNCRFNGNDADHGGGMFNDSGDPNLNNCTFSGNLAVEGGGGMYNDRGSRPTLKNCKLTGNLADDGAGMCNEQSYPNLTNCTFCGNQAGDEGGAMYDKHSSNPTLTNCLFIVNSAYVGGGISNNNSSSEAINCTFSGNRATAYGGGIDNVRWCRPKVHNCILWGDSATDGNEIALRFETGYGCPELTITYSDVEGGPNSVYLDPNCTLNWGEGNIDEDPCFVGPNSPDNGPNTCEDNDYHLRSVSTCIDAGDNTHVPPDTNDLDDRPRIVDGDCNDSNVVDMGVYEFSYAFVGDFDGHCDVNLPDFAILAFAWLTEAGDGQYNPECDISLPPDEYIDWRDVKILRNNWLAGK
ncbi:MAG: right-handed parallel beta-helix repeat-containing protein [Planctomycetota bacterium]|jgi:hypothetical protein